MHRHVEAHSAGRRRVRVLGGTDHHRRDVILRLAVRDDATAARATQATALGGFRCLSATSGGDVTVRRILRRKWATTTVFARPEMLVVVTVVLAVAVHVVVMHQQRSTAL